MIIVTLNLVLLLQHLGKVLTVLPRDTVDDTALASESGVKQVSNVIVNILYLLFWPDLVDQVGTIERTLKANGVLHVQPSHYVILHFYCGSSGKAKDGDIRIAFFEHVQA